MRAYYLVLTGLLVVALPSLAIAGNATGQTSNSSYCNQAISRCQQINSWDVSLAIGIGGRSNPVIESDDQPIVLVPQWSWYGEEFFIDNLEAGYTLYDTPAQMLNVLATISFDQYFFEDDVSLGNFTLQETGSIAIPDTNGSSTNSSSTLDKSTINKRRIAALAGIDYNYFYNNLHLNTQWLSDISGVHNGQEARVAITYDWPTQQDLYSLTMGLSWQSKEVIDYYYGLKANEVPSSQFIYRPEDGTSTFIQMSWERQLSQRWSLYTSFKYRQLSSKISQSPLVTEDHVITIFTGGIYHF